MPKSAISNLEGNVQFRLPKRNSSPAVDPTLRKRATQTPDEKRTDKDEDSKDGDGMDGDGMDGDKNVANENDGQMI